MGELPLTNKDELLDIELDSNVSAAECLSEVSDKLQEIKDSGEEVSQLAIESLNKSIKCILKNIGAKPKSVISVESFSNPMHKARSLEVAIEGLGDWIDAIYDKIYVLMGKVKEFILGTNRTLRARAKMYIDEANYHINRLSKQSGKISFSDTSSSRFSNILPLHDANNRAIDENFYVGQLLHNFNYKANMAVERLHSLPGALTKEGYNIHEIIRSTNLSNLITESGDINSGSLNLKFVNAVQHYNQKSAQIAFNVFNTSFEYDPRINTTYLRTIASNILSILYGLSGLAVGAKIALAAKAKFATFIASSAVGYLIAGTTAYAATAAIINATGNGLKISAYSVTEVTSDKVSQSSYVQEDSTTYSEVIKSLNALKHLANTMLTSIDNHNRVLDTLEDINKSIRHELSADVPDTTLKNMYRRVCIVSNINLARQYVSTIKKASKTMMFSIDRACDEMVALAKKCK